MHRLQANYQFKHRHSASNTFVTDDEIQAWYERVLALQLEEPEHLPPVSQYVCVWITNKPLKGDRKVLLECCPNLVLVTRMELESFISPVLLELALLVGSPPFVTGEVNEASES